MPVSPISGMAPISPVELPGNPLAPVDRAKSQGFEQVFRDAIDKVGKAQQESQQHLDRFLAGEDEELHTVALAGTRAELAFDLFMQVRNKVVQAYQEVMRMPM
jgi:flagellar hook-basal body complex protein FliE